MLRNTRLLALCTSYASLRRVSVALALAAATSALSPGGGDAQTHVRADVLEQQARELRKDVDQWGRSAVKLRASAELREVGDPRGYWSLIEAAHLFYYSGHPTKARRAWEAAAPTALENGDVPAAARAYLDAALIAYEQGDMQSFQDNARGAERLAQSRVLTVAQRDLILGQIRIGKTKRVAVR